MLLTMLDKQQQKIHQKQNKTKTTTTTKKTRCLTKSGCWVQI